MSLITRTACTRIALARHVTGTYYEYGNSKKVLGFRKPPVPHEDLLIENDGRYPPHLKIDLDHPENWPKHYPPFYESRRPAKYPLPRAVMIGFCMFFGLCFWTNPTWLAPWIVAEFPCLRKDDNWVKLEDIALEERLYPWQHPLVDEDKRDPELRKSMGFWAFCIYYSRETMIKLCIA